MNRAEQFKDVIDMLQLVTFNDFDEGTMFEPTVETGFDYLKRIQEFIGVEYGEEELKLVHRLYLLRKDYAENAEIQQSLNLASMHLRNLEIAEAALMLNSIHPLSGSGEFTPEGLIPGATLLFPNPYMGGRLNILFGNDPGHSVRISIHDMTGRIVYERWPVKDRTGLSVENLNIPEGIYLVVSQGEHDVKTVQLVVTR